MGTDKAELVVDGETLLERAIRCATAAGARSIVVVGGSVRTATDQVRFIEDSIPGSGPLAALIDGLRALSSDHPEAVPGVAQSVAVFVAVDHPDLQPTELVTLARRLQLLPDQVMAVVPEVNGRSQPLHGAYRLALAGPLADVLAAGERSLWGALSTFAVDRPDRSGEPGAVSYRDLDDPRQFAEYNAEHAEIRRTIQARTPEGGR